MLRLKGVGFRVSGFRTYGLVGEAVVPPVGDSNLCLFCSRLLRAFPESHIPVDRHGGAGRVA